MYKLLIPKLHNQKIASLFTFQRTALFLMLFSLNATVFSQIKDSATYQQGASAFDNLEFDITGEEIISLPSSVKHTIEEQPVFNADNVSSDVPFPNKISQGELVREQASPLDNEKYNTLYSFIKYGRFATPHLELSYGNRVEEQTYFYTKGMYESSRGFEKNTDYSNANIALAGGTTFNNNTSWLSGATGDMRLELNTRHYRFFGSLAPSQERTATNFLFNAGFSPKNLLGASHDFNVMWNAFSLNDTRSQSEHQFSFSGDGSKQFNGLMAKINGGMWIDALERSVANPFLLNAGGGIEISRPSLSQFQLGVAGYIYRHSNNITQVIIYPQVRYIYFPETHWSLSAAFLPSVKKNPLSELVTQNPYITNSNLFLQNTFIHFTLAAEYHPVEPLRLKSGVLIERSSKTPIYTLVDSTRSWQVSYEGTTSFTEWKTEGEYALGIGRAVYGEILFRSRSNTFFRKSSKLAYIPTAEITSGYKHHFNFLLDADFQMSYIGRDNTLGDVLIGSLECSYPLTNAMHIIANVNNMFDRTYNVWQYYRGERAAYSIGITGSW